MSLINIQMGKNGLTQNFIDNLEKTFKKHELVKISVLKSACRNREELKSRSLELCSELKKRLNKKFTCKIVGYTLNIKKWRKLNSK